MNYPKNEDNIIITIKVNDNIAKEILVTLYKYVILAPTNNMNLFHTTKNSSIESMEEQTTKKKNKTKLPLS